MHWNREKKTTKYSANEWTVNQKTKTKKKRTTNKRMKEEEEEEEVMSDLNFVVESRK